VESSHPLHDYFLPRQYAIIIPVALLTLGVTLVGSFIALVMIKSKPKKMKDK